MRYVPTIITEPHSANFCWELHSKSENLDGSLGSGDKSHGRMKKNMTRAADAISINPDQAPARPKTTPAAPMAHSFVASIEKNNGTNNTKKNAVYRKLADVM